MPYFDIQVRYIHIADRGVSESQSVDFVILEEIEWEEPDIDSFAAWFLDNYGNPESQTWINMFLATDKFNSYSCEEGYYEAYIRAYKSRPDLVYNMTASRGTFSDDSPTVSTDQIKTNITVSKKAYHEFDDTYISSIECATWEGNVYGANGQLLTDKPTIKVVSANPDNSNDYRLKLVFSEVCSGNIRIVYTTQFEVWKLQIEPRVRDEAGGASGQGTVDTNRNNNSGIVTAGVELSTTSGEEGLSCSEFYNTEDTSAAYSSTVLAIWATGDTSLDVTVPEDMQEDCIPGYSSTLTLNTGESEEDCYELHILVDPCTKEILDQWTETVSC